MFTGAVFFQSRCMKVMGYIAENMVVFITYRNFPSMHHADGYLWLIYTVVGYGKKFLPCVIPTPYSS